MYGLPKGIFLLQLTQAIKIKSRLILWDWFFWQYTIRAFSWNCFLMTWKSLILLWQGRNFIFWLHIDYWNSFRFIWRFCSFGNRHLLRFMNRNFSDFLQSWNYCFHTMGENDRFPIDCDSWSFRIRSCWIWPGQHSKLWVGNYFDIAGVVIVKFVCFGHLTITKFHDFEDVISMLFFDEFDIHDVWDDVEGFC